MSAAINKKLPWIVVGGVVAAAAIIVAVWIWTRPPADVAPPKKNGVVQKKEAEKEKEKKEPAPAVVRASVSLAKASEFLYSGDKPRQVGMKAGTIEPRRAAVLRGLVHDREGKPLAGVKIAIDHHPEFGSTDTQPDGIFDLTVNGGGLLCVAYRKEGYVSSCRYIAVPWQDYAWLPDVVLVQPDDKTTAIDLKSAVPIQVARGSQVKDKDGERQATLLFPQGTEATMILPDGRQKPLTNFKVRATEYTVGPQGPASMPAALPPNSAYTYAVEFRVDEAVAAGAVEVRFSKPIPNYVENFLDFPVGTNLPLGYLHRGKGVWIASENGRVVKLLGVQGGLADLDVSGAGKPADPQALKDLRISDDERRELAKLYQPGQALWRTLISHFGEGAPIPTPDGSSYDTNLGYGKEKGDDDPDGKAKSGDDQTDGCSKDGHSIVDIHNQSLGERVRITGSQFQLHYQSARVAGRKSSRTLKIWLTGANVPKRLLRIELEIQVAGQRFRETLLPTKPLQELLFHWDGKDAYGRVIEGIQAATVRIGYVYKGVYFRTDRFGENGISPLTGSGTVTAYRTRQEIVLWQEMKTHLNNWDAHQYGLGGWSLDINHAYDPIGRVLYFGDGRRLDARQGTSKVITTVTAGAGSTELGDGGPAAKATIRDIAGGTRTGGGPRLVGIGLAVGLDGSLYLADKNSRVRRIGPDGIITTVAGGGTDSPGDNGPAVKASLQAPNGLALGSDGSLYISESYRGHRVRRVRPDGVITTIAGTGEGGYSGDGGPAVKAKLNSPLGLAVGPDGCVYIADRDNRRIRRIGPDGIISTIAGTGKSGSTGDGGPATKSQLAYPTAVAVAADGGLYIADSLANVVRKVGVDGIITTVAGQVRLNPYEFDTIFSGDGGSASKAEFHNPTALALGPGNVLYVVDTQNHRVRRIATDGIITTVAGGGKQETGDGGQAIHAPLSHPAGVAVRADGTLFIYDGGQFKTVIAEENDRIRQVSPALPGFTDQQIAIASDDGRELYKFTAVGRHLETLDAITGKTLYRFHHDGEGRLTKMDDAYGNATTIERDAKGQPTAIVAPFGQRTTLSLDADGYLASIANPAKEGHHFTYGNGGLMASYKDPRGNTSRFAYDDLGRLTRDQNAADGFIALERSEKTGAYEVALTTALKPPTRYQVEKLPTGAENRLNQCCCGAETKVEIAADRSGKILYPDGSTSTWQEQPDPRWGMQAPLLKSFSLATPGGKKADITLERKATLADPANPMSLQALSQVLSLNGRKYTSTLDVGKKQIISTTPGGRQTITTLDEFGRVVKREVAGLLPVHFKYDERGRLMTITQGAGQEARVLSIDYNAKGQIEAMIDPLKRKVRFEYDKAGRVAKQILADGREVAFAHDPGGNLKSLTPPGKPAHTFEYTPVNLTKDYQPPDVGAGGKDTSYSYNKDKQLTRVLRPDSKTIELAYDKVGHLDTLTIPGGKYQLSFDAKKEQLKSIAGPDGKLSFAYDGFLRTTTTWDGLIKGTVSRTFDNDFRVTSHSVNGGPPIAYKYDPDGLLIRTGAMTLDRDPKTGLVTGTKLGDVTTTVEYDGFGARKHYTAKFKDKVLFAVEYERDPLGRIVKLAETIDGQTSVFTYDYYPAGWLKAVTKNGKEIAHYEYDRNGNRLSYRGQLGSFKGSYDNQDRVVQYGDVTFKHTANGEWASKTEKGKTTGYEYDVLGNLKAVALPDGTKIEYLVDGAGRRIGKKINGKLVQGFLWEGQLRPIAELDGNG